MSQALPEALLTRADGLVGDAVEAAVRVKHTRRLARLGWSGALVPEGDGLWAAGEPPPREGCQLRVLIDGEEAFAAVARAIADARETIHITGWHLAAHFNLARGEHVVLGGLLAQAAERVDVRVVVWAGAPVPAFRPSRKEVGEAIRTLTRETKIHCEADPANIRFTAITRRRS